MHVRNLLPALLLAACAAHAEPIRDKVEKHWDAWPARDASETIPDVPAAQWGKWHFWNGQWWARQMFQPEAQGPSWDPPPAGRGSNWNGYNSVWLRAKRPIPAEWSGLRVSLEQNGIRGCRVVVFVNGMRAGEIKEPTGSVDVAPLLRYGEENEFHMLLCGKNSDFKLEKDPPFLVAKEAYSVDDVFANTSWREKKITVETTLTVPAACRAEVLAEILDRNGKVVKKVGGAFDLKEGENVVKPSAPWADPIAWELGRGYLYTLKVKVRFGGRDGKVVDYRDVKFGFREIWREKRKIFMNGHEQKFRVSYNFNCDKYGAKFLQGIGYNCVQFAHQVVLDPFLGDDMLEYLSENGIAVVMPTAGFDWNSKGPLLNPGEKREAFKRLQAANLRRSRNWPCVAMVYMGVNAYLPQWSYEAKHLGCGDDSGFAKMMADLVAAAKETNPNVLYFSHSDGSTGEIASANLYFNWVPLQERVEWPSAWAGGSGRFPFQACEFGHPYQYSWYQDKRDLVTELLAIYYGEEAYRTEPAKISDRHVEALYIRRVLHPLFWKFTDDFVTRLTRAWRTYGINAGIVWFNLDYGYGMPGWTLEGIYNDYGPTYRFKSEEEVPKGRPDWAFPSWDIVRKTNLDFLGWLGGAPAFTDRRHAWRAGETVEKQCIMLWDGPDARAFGARWTATLGGRRVAAGAVKPRRLVSNVPDFAPVSFVAPAVEKKTAGEIRIEFLDAKGAKQSEDSFAFEIHPKRRNPFAKAPRFALWDPDGKTGPELRARGLSNFAKVASPADARGERFLVVGANALGKGGGFGALPMDAVKDGLRIFILPQSADAWKAFGFEVQDRASRVLFLRDRVSSALRGIGDEDLHDWSGASPELRVKHGRNEPRWTGNLSLAALQLKSPTVAGYRPQIEGEFDMNYAALLDYSVGRGSVKFCTLDFFGRGATDAAAERTFDAVFGDFFSQGGARDTAGPPATRTVFAAGEEARRIARDAGVAHKPGKDAGADGLLLVAAGSDATAQDVLAAAKRGANVLVVANAAVSRGLGLSVAPPSAEGVYRVDFDHASPVLRGVGQAQLRWRDRLHYGKLSGAGWTIDAEGLVASKTLENGATIVATAFDPYAIERGITADRVLVVDGKPREKPIGSGKVDDCRKRADISFERSRQLAARLLTNLGAAPDGVSPLYSGLVKPFDPYFYTYW